jgi:hypothetical protein
MQEMDMPESLGKSELFTSKMELEEEARIISSLVAAASKWDFGEGLGINTLYGGESYGLGGGFTYIKVGGIFSVPQHSYRNNSNFGLEYAHREIRIGIHTHSLVGDVRADLLYKSEGDYLNIVGLLGTQEVHIRRTVSNAESLSIRIHPDIKEIHSYRTGVKEIDHNLSVTDHIGVISNEIYGTKIDPYKLLYKELKDEQIVRQEYGKNDNVFIDPSRDTLLTITQAAWNSNVGETLPGVRITSISAAAEAIRAKLKKSILNEPYSEVLAKLYSKHFGQRG